MPCLASWPVRGGPVIDRQPRTHRAGDSLFRRSANFESAVDRLLVLRATYKDAVGRQSCEPIPLLASGPPPGFCWLRTGSDFDTRRGRPRVLNVCRS